jgi:molecular chaperone DnaK
MSGIGIDFGTTNSSLVAFIKKDDFFSKGGTFEYFGSINEKEKPTPSVVWYHDKRIDVGKDAKDNYNKFCDVPGHHMETSIKSKLGTDKKVSIFGQLTDPYKVASKIIEHLIKIAEMSHAAKAGISLNKAVFSIPINFNGRQRADLRKAAHEAGIEVDTFIHEPFAALIGYLYSESSYQYQDIPDSSYVLVFDWGGGTLDITVVKKEKEQMYEVGTGELSGIAGDKFDDELAVHVKNRFQDTYSGVFSPEYIRKKLSEKRDRILSNSEKCKIALSSKTEANIYIEDIIYDESARKHFNIDEMINRSDFEACIQHHVQAASSCIHDAIRAAGISPEQISFVLMTGGTSNIPLVRKTIENMFGSRVKIASNSEMVIAQGAAVVAEMGWSPYLSKSIMVELSDGSYWTAFEQGMPLVREKMPAKKEVFTCVDTRDSEAKVIIAEGRSDKKDRNLAVINIPVLNFPTLHYPDELEIDFSINENIILTVSGYGKQAGKRKHIELHDVCFGLERK